MVGYSIIAARYEQIARKEREELRRVGWNNSERALARYKYISNLASQTASIIGRDLVLFDIGCRLCNLYDHINLTNRNNNFKIDYRGFDISSYLVKEALASRPHLEVIEYDFLNQKSKICDISDLSVMNGVFTQKFDLQHNKMVCFLREMLIAVKQNTSLAIVFNVMSDRVDYKLENAFHLSKDEISELMQELAFATYYIESIVPYEYFVRAYV